VAFSIGIGVFASSVGRNGYFWGGVSLLFTPLATGIVLALMEATGAERVVGAGSGKAEREAGASSAKAEREAQSPGREFDPDEHDKKCPMCAEYIKLEAYRCKHCGHEMAAEEVKRQVEEKKQEVKRRRVESQVKVPKDSDAPPMDEVSARCGECHYPLRGDEDECPNCQSELVWS